MHPAVFNAQINILGWGPSFSLYIWDGSLYEGMYQYEIHWRYFRIQHGRADLTVQWL